MIVLLGLCVAVGAGIVGYVIGWRRAEARSVSTFLSGSATTGPLGDDSASGELAADVERAVADLRLGVVVVGPEGERLYRNHQAEQFASGRHGGALVEAALDRVVEGALVGLSLEESVDIHGPPAKSFLVQASPTYHRGAIDGAVGVIDDVTESRRLDRIRSDFVVNVSHELRTPVGALSVLAETIADSDDPEVIDRMAERMQREAARLSDTLEDLLALSRLESGPTPEPETMDLRSVVTVAVERTAEAARQRQVRVLVENRRDRPILVDGDQSQLVSAAANLIDNGIKYSDPGAAVFVTLDIEESDGGRAKLSVVDSGIGIPERDLDRIFERFYRVDTGRSRDTGGTGLGLSIVRHALLNHGGAIDVTSIEGQGSTFLVTLPLSPAQARLSEDKPTTGGDAERQWTC